MAKIYRVIHIKLYQLDQENVHMITDLGLPTKRRPNLSAIKVTNISQSFTYKMAAKENWHKYGTKLRHCQPMYTRR